MCVFSICTQVVGILAYIHCWSYIILSMYIYYSLIMDTDIIIVIITIHTILGTTRHCTYIRYLVPLVTVHKILGATRPCTYNTWYHSSLYIQYLVPLITVHTILGTTRHCTYSTLY